MQRAGGWPCVKDRKIASAPARVPTTTSACLPARSLLCELALSSSFFRFRSSPILSRSLICLSASSIFRQAFDSNSYCFVLAPNRSLARRVMNRFRKPPNQPSPKRVSSNTRSQSRSRTRVGQPLNFRSATLEVS